MNKLTWGFFYSVCKEKNNEELRQAKTLKACNSLYKGFYFITVTIWGYYVLKDAKYLPWTLLGHGNLQYLRENYPIHSWPEGLRPYYLGTMGYHVHQLFSHALHPIRNDFVEMMLHHIVTLFLYGFSYLINMTAGGLVIMFLHDWADVFTSFVRCFTETTLISFTLISAFGMTVSWAYTRLVIFPQIIFYACFSGVDIYQGAGFIGDKFLGSLLIVLFILHIYWFYVLIKSIKKFV